MIKPTVGRVVWYWPTVEEVRDLKLANSWEQPLAATIAYVHSDRTVNLSVVDHIGQSFGRTNVVLLSVAEGTKAAPGYAQWMPYQKGQAAKTEAPVDALTALLGSITQRQADPVPMSAAPRVTLEHIESLIESERYFTAANGAAAAGYTMQSDDDDMRRLTFCVLALRNGFTITGQSIPQVGAEFGAERGRKQARENAISQIWPLELYLLKQRLY